MKGIFKKWEFWLMVIAIILIIVLPPLIEWLKTTDWHKSKITGSRGGLLVGETDKEDGKGIKVLAPKGQIIMGGGEIVINENSAKKHCDLLSRINQEGGGVAIPCDIIEEANTTNQSR